MHKILPTMMSKKEESKPRLLHSKPAHKPTPPLNPLPNIMPNLLEFQRAKPLQQTKESKIRLDLLLLKPSLQMKMVL